MHDALSNTRSQAPKNAIVGILDVESGVTRVDKGRGSHARTMGSEGPRGWELLPEEALYLVERGNMELRWRDADSGWDTSEGNEEDPGEEEEGLPMSLQAAYTFLIGALGLTVERYLVYAGLKRSGYVVLRGPAWYKGDEYKEFKKPPPTVGAMKEGWGQWWNMLFKGKSQQQPPMGPLVGKGFYRNYSDIYKLLSIIPSHDPTIPNQSEAHNAETQTLDFCADDENTYVPPIRPCFYVWKPSTVFKKSAPGPPDFRVAVLDARDDCFPTLQQLDQLLERSPYAPPPATINQQPAQRLKHGYKNVILGVVDQGVVSYIRIADAGFSREKIYERAIRGAGHKRGGGRNRGRGKGRGR